MNVNIRERDFGSDLILPSMTYRVDRYSWSVFGGPKTAQIKVFGADLDLWALIQHLRCPVIIYAPQGDAVWWGYLADIDAVVKTPAALADRYRSERIRVGVTIEETYNRVAYAYVNVNLTTGLQSRATTAWAEDTISQGEYGIKELLASGSGGTSVHAEAARDKLLADHKYPVPVIRPDYSAGSSEATLTCVGWWTTLGWRYYANSGTNAVDTATQIGAICTAKGEFFESVDVEDTSGIAILETRDGDGSALFEAVQLLEMGTSNFRRLIASVDEGRRVRIYEEPAKSTTPHQILTDGSLFDPYGSPIRPETCPVGFWAKLKDAIPPSVDTSLLADPSLVFIEEMEYIVAENRLVPSPRGALDPWDFPKAKDG